MLSAVSMSLHAMEMTHGAASWQPIHTLPADVKGVLLETLVNSGNSLEESVKNIKSYLWAHPKIFAALNQKTFNALVIALADRWVYNDYEKAIAALRKQEPFQLEKKLNFQKKFAHFISTWTQNSQAFIKAYVYKDIESMRGLIISGMPYYTNIIYLFGSESADEDARDNALLAAGADETMFRKMYKVRQLFKVIKQNNVTRVQELLAQGVNPNVVNSMGQTPLMMAAALRTDNPVILTTLIKAGAKINAQDRVEGHTALHYALGYQGSDSTENAAELVRHGALFDDVLKERGWFRFR